MSIALGSVKFRTNKVIITCTLLALSPDAPIFQVPGNEANCYAKVRIWKVTSVCAGNGTCLGHEYLDKLERSS